MQHSPDFVFDFCIQFTCSWLGRQSPSLFTALVSRLGCVGNASRLLAQAAVHQVGCEHAPKSQLRVIRQRIVPLHRLRHPRQSGPHRSSKGHLPKNSPNLVHPLFFVFLSIDPSTLCCAPGLAVPSFAAAKAMHTDNSTGCSRPAFFGRDESSEPPTCLGLGHHSEGMQSNDRKCPGGGGWCPRDADMPLFD